MLPSNESYRLTAAAIEFAHDHGIALVWPGLEPVEQGSCRDLNLLHSAASQPFQECFGMELYPSLEAKAAYLFYHLTTSHVFGNGNKRTAVLCLDMFLTLNGRYLLLNNREVYDLSKSVASSGENGRSFNKVFHSLRLVLEQNTISFQSLLDQSEAAYWSYVAYQDELRSAAYNQPGAPLKQRDHRV